MGTAFDSAIDGDASIVLLRPKFEQNAAQVVRAAACFGVSKVTLCQPRYQPVSGSKGHRRPRPLRMKDYCTVQITTATAMQFPTGYTPVAVEFMDMAVFA